MVTGKKPDVIFFDEPETTGFAAHEPRPAFIGADFSTIERAYLARAYNSVEDHLPVLVFDRRATEKSFSDPYDMMWDHQKRALAKSLNFAMEHGKTARSVGMSSVLGAAYGMSPALVGPDFYFDTEYDGITGKPLRLFGEFKPSRGRDIGKSTMSFSMPILEYLMRPRAREVVPTLFKIAWSPTGRWR